MVRSPIVTCSFKNIELFLLTGLYIHTYRHIYTSVCVSLLEYRSSAIGSLAKTGHDAPQPSRSKRQDLSGKALSPNRFSRHESLGPPHHGFCYVRGSAISPPQ